MMMFGLKILFCLKNIKKSSNDFMFSYKNKNSIFMFVYCFWLSGCLISRNIVGMNDQNRISFACLCLCFALFAVWFQACLVQLDNHIVIVDKTVYDLLDKNVLLVELLFVLDLRLDFVQVPCDQFALVHTSELFTYLALFHNLSFKNRNKNKIQNSILSVSISSSFLRMK